MATLCGWASIDENGHAHGGQAGDQTGREVKTGPWYNFGQTVVIRPNDREKGKQMASVMKKICNNKNVGYDQWQRTTLYVEMSRCGWNPDKISRKVETDCSALIAVVCTACGYSVSPDVWTGNLRNALTRTKKFTALTESSYVHSDKNLRAGDIILNPDRHVIMALEDGENVKKESKTTTKKVKTLAQVAQEVLEGKWGNGEERKKNLRKAGYDVDKVQVEVNKLEAKAKKAKKPYTGTFPKLPKKGYIAKGDKGVNVGRMQAFLKWYGTYKGAVDNSAGELTDEAIYLYQKKEWPKDKTQWDRKFGPNCLNRARVVKK